MRGAALHFSREVENPEEWDLLLTCGLLSLSDLRSLWRDRCPPAIVYFHENQLSYPLQEGEKMDYQFGFTDITTGLTADRILFNSNFHLNSFFRELPGFIGKMPEFKPHWAADIIRRKSSVLYPGCTFPSGILPHQEKKSDRPLIIWNHRWEYDKDPETFFSTLYELDNEGLDFNLALLGENYQKVPKPFLKAREYFGGRILHYGWVESRAEYINWLMQGDFIISTALQENFGISVVEAIRFGCFPLLPDRLSYPELIPEKFHFECIYRNKEDLKQKLANFLGESHVQAEEKNRRTVNELSACYEKFSWELNISDYDDIFMEVYNS